MNVMVVAPDGSVLGYRLTVLVKQESTAEARGP
jgi:hypothetical protein